MATNVFLAPTPIQQFFDNSGRPNSGGSILTQVGGVNYATYQDSAGTTPLPNPIPLNSRGEISNASGVSSQLFLSAGVAYTFTQFDANGNQINQAPWMSPGGTFADGSIGRVVDSIATLRTLTHLNFTRAFVTGYYAAGDGGGGAYWYDPTDTTSADNGGTIIVAADGGRWKMSNTAVLSVKQFGAKGIGSGDDTATMQAAITWAKTAGAKLRIPAGVYMVSAALTIDLSTQTSFGTTQALTIEGDGSINTELRWITNAAGTIIKVIGNTATAPITQCIFSGFKCTTANARVGYGIQFTAGAYNKFRDIVMYGMDTGWDLTDILSSTWEACHMFLCNKNLYARRGVYSRPNSLTFIGCVNGNAVGTGIQIDNGSNLNWIGGSMENNGNNGVNGVAVLLNAPGYEGGVAAVFDGVYFEGNAALADVYIISDTSNANATTVSFEGCSFNRNSSTIFAAHNIRVDSSNSTDAEVVISLTGNSFRGFNGYTPNGARQYVVHNGPGPFRFVDNGNYYQSLTEKPPYFTTAPFCQLTFTGATGAIRASNNVASVVRNSTGNYTINFIEQGTAEYLLKWGAASTQCIAYVTSQAAGSITVQFAALLTGNPVDPSIGMIELCQ